MKYEETKLIYSVVSDHLLRNMTIPAAEWTMAKTPKERREEIEKTYEKWREKNYVWPVPLEKFFSFLEERFEKWYLTRLK